MGYMNEALDGFDPERPETWKNAPSILDQLWPHLERLHIEPPDLADEIPYTEFVSDFRRRLIKAIERRC